MNSAEIMINDVFAGKI